jgi:4-amino-4-deoxy-L-arabinose transferase-like glycosyltransferase
VRRLRLPRFWPRGSAPDAAERGNWGRPGAALAAILGLAAALRLVGIQYGLPFTTLLNPDEQSIVPRAWKMVHGGGLDPNWFDYPTLVMYVLAPFQAWQDAPSILTARLVIVAFGLLAVAATWWLGRKAYGTLAAAIGAVAVAVETTHVGYSHMAVTDVPLTAGIAASLALMISGRLEWAGLAAGLATGAKYPGVFLLAPLVVAGWGRWRRLTISAGLAAAAFLATSPYVLVHPGLAWDSAARVQRLARAGWLGFERDHTAPIAFALRLWHGFGPALLIAVAGLVLALVRRRRADLILVVFVVAYFVDLLTIRAHFDRYVLPLVPPLAVLAGRVRALAPVTLVLLIVPLALSIRDDVRLTRTDTRVVAYQWIVSHLPEDSRIAADSSTAPLIGYPVVPLALPGPGRPTDPLRDIGRLRADGVAYVVATGAIADRVLAARKLYPREARFYDQLRTVAKRLYYVTAGDGRNGPWVAVYRL